MFRPLPPRVPPPSFSVTSTTSTQLSLSHPPAPPAAVEGVEAAKKDSRHHGQHEVPSSEIVGMEGSREEEYQMEVVMQEKEGREGERACHVTPPHHRRNAEWARAFQMCLQAMAEGKDFGEEAEGEGGKEGKGKVQRSEDEKEEKEREVMEGLAWGMGLLVE